MRHKFSNLVLTLSILATLPTSLFAMSDELSTQGDIDQRGELPTITHTNSSGADADLLREFGSLGFEKIRGIGPEQTERRAPEQTIVAEPAVEVAPVSTAPVKQVVKPLRIIAAMAVKTSEMVGLRKAEPKRQLSSTTKRISNYAVRAKPKFFSVISLPALGEIFLSVNNASADEDAVREFIKIANLGNESTTRLAFMRLSQDDQIRINRMVQGQNGGPGGGGSGGGGSGGGGGPSEIGIAAAAMIAAISGPVVAAINAKKDVAITNIDAAKDITINAQNNATKKELATDAAQVALVQAKTAEAINLDNRMSEVKRDKMQIAELDAARVDKNKMDSKALDAKQALSLAQIGLSKYLADAQTVLSDKQYRLTQSLVGLQVGAGGAASKLTYKATNSQNALSSGGLAYRQPMQLSSTWSPSSARTRALQRGVASDKLLTASLNPTATSATAPGSRGMQRGVAAKSLVWGSTSRSRYRTSDNLVMQAGIEFSNPFAAKSRGAAPADRGLASESTRRIRSTRGSDPSESGDSGHLDD